MFSPDLYVQADNWEQNKVLSRYKCYVFLLVLERVYF